MSFLQIHTISTVSQAHNPHKTKLLGQTQPETYHKDQAMRDQIISSLRQAEKTLFYQFHQNQKKKRQKLLEWAFMVGRQHLELKYKTLELAMRIFDYYCFLKSQSPQMQHGNSVKKQGNPLDNKFQACLTLITCMFTCSKYNEVYPPYLCEFQKIIKFRFSRKNIIQKQLEILQLTQFAFTISTVSGWYEHLYDDPMPEWAYQYYFKACTMSTEDLAKSIRRIVRTSKMEEIRLKYATFENGDQKQNDS